MEESTSRVLELFSVHQEFCKAMLDAYVVVDDRGKVVKSNTMFSQVVGKKSKQILKADSLDELITFKIEDRNLGVQELLTYGSPIRIDEVQGETETTKGMNLLLGCYPFRDGDTSLGFFLLIRDVTAETNLQGKYKDKATQSVTDKLTGLFNRGYFETYLPESIAHLQNERRRGHVDEIHGSLSLVMSDIDHFKKINDTYGHQAGDFVLGHVATILKTHYRKTDTICRYGGEEFLVILPSTNLEEAFVAADKVRKAIAAYTFDFNGTIIPVTISMGIATLEAQESSEGMIARADAALYHAKDHGRNRVCRHRGESGSID